MVRTTTCTPGRHLEQCCRPCTTQPQHALQVVWTTAQAGQHASQQPQSYHAVSIRSALQVLSTMSPSRDPQPPCRQFQSLASAAGHAWRVTAGS